MINNILNDFKNKHGVYLFFNSRDICIYIGKSSKDLYKRINDHFFGYTAHLQQECYDDVSYILISKCSSKTDADIYETYLINQYSPKYNIRKKYGDSSSLSLPELSYTKIYKSDLLKNHKCVKKHDYSRDDAQILCFLEEKNGTYLSEEEKNKLIGMCNYRKNRKLKKSVSSINYFISNQYGYTVKSVKLYTKHDYKKCRWLIEKI